MREPAGIAAWIRSASAGRAGPGRSRPGCRRARRRRPAGWSVTRPSRAGEAQLDEPVPQPPPDLGHELRVVGDAAAQLHRQRRATARGRDVETTRVAPGRSRSSDLELLHRADQPVRVPRRRSNRTWRTASGPASTGASAVASATIRARASSGTAGSSRLVVAAGRGRRAVEIGRDRLGRGDPRQLGGRWPVAVLAPRGDADQRRARASRRHGDRGDRPDRARPRPAGGGRAATTAIPGGDLAGERLRAARPRRRPSRPRGRRAARPPRPCGRPARRRAGSRRRARSGRSSRTGAGRRRPRSSPGGPRGSRWPSSPGAW